MKIALPDGSGALYVPNETEKAKLEEADTRSEAQANVRAAVPGLEAYNAESTAGSSTYHKAGPAGDIREGPCS